MGGFHAPRLPWFLTELYQEQFVSPLLPKATLACFKPQQSPLPLNCHVLTIQKLEYADAIFLVLIVTCQFESDFCPQAYQKPFDCTHTVSYTNLSTEYNLKDQLAK